MNVYPKLIISMVLAAPLVFLSGCKAPPPANVPLVYPVIPKTAPINLDVAQNKMTLAATSVSQSMQEMAEIEQAAHPNLTFPAPVSASAWHMTQMTSLDWTGPIEPLVRSIAKASGYKVRILGNKPAIPALVDIHAKNLPLATILRNATYQVQKKASIHVYPRRNIIELRYLG